MDAGCSVGSPAATEFDLSLLEVFVKFVDFCLAGFEVVICRPQCSASVEKASEMPEGVFVVDGCIALRCGNVLMSHEPGEDVYRQTGGQGGCGEESSEIMRSEFVVISVLVFEAGSTDCVLYGFPDPLGTHSDDMVRRSLPLRSWNKWGRGSP